MSVKQVIVIRKDLKMRRGKEIAQGAHAACMFLVNKVKSGEAFTQAEQDWMNGLFTKICVRVNSEEELLAIHERAQEAGVQSCLVRDSGLTEFAGVPTYTCLALGPDEGERLAPISGHLELY